MEDNYFLKTTQWAQTKSEPTSSKFFLIAIIIFAVIIIIIIISSWILSSPRPSINSSSHIQQMNKKSNISSVQTSATTTYVDESGRPIDISSLNPGDYEIIHDD